MEPTTVHDHPETETNMSLFAFAEDDAERASTWTRFLEAREKERSGAPLAEVRPKVARDVGVAPGTLENARKRRLKSPASWLMRRLRAAVLREIEQELRHLEHARHVLLATGEGLDSPEMAEVEAGLARARQALGLPPVERLAPRRPMLRVIDGGAAE